MPSQRLPSMGRRFPPPSLSARVGSLFVFPRPGVCRLSYNPLWPSKAPISRSNVGLFRNQGVTVQLLPTQPLTAASSNFRASPPSPYQSASVLYLCMCMRVVVGSSLCSHQPLSARPLSTSYIHVARLVFSSSRLSRLEPNPCPVHPMVP